MKKLFPIFVLFVLFHSLLFAQTENKTKVMTLGTFHFDFPNNDVVQVDKEDHIDVLKPKYQADIKKIVNQLANFKPTIIAIERSLQNQSKVDSLYHKYRRDEHKLTRSEAQQIGFRLARQANLDKIYAIDVWGKHYQNVKKALNDSTKRAAFVHYYINNPDTSIKFTGTKPVYATTGILAELIRLNQPEHIKKSLGNYLTGHFKFELKKYDYFGVDFETGRWFNRNLKIFRNIQRIKTKPDDRILIIIGAGHLNLLNIYFKASPEYVWISPLKYLKKQ